jgi:hypothetical protein
MAALQLPTLAPFSVLSDSATLSQRCTKWGKSFEFRRDDYATALEKLDAYFKPQRNIPFERHMFIQATQDPSEMMDTYVTRLKRLAQTCDYGTLSDEMIRDQVLEKCYSTRLRCRLLREETLTLDVILRIARALEASAYRQAQQIEGTKNSESDAEKSFAYVIQPRSDTITSREFRSERPTASPQR